MLYMPNLCIYFHLFLFLHEVKLQDLETNGKRKEESFLSLSFLHIILQGGLNVSGLKSSLLMDLKKSFHNSIREMAAILQSNKIVQSFVKCSES